MMIVMTLASAFAVTGCKTEDKKSKDPNTINVLISKAGYGTTFIYDLKEKFEAAYAEEGYKMNVLNPMTDLHSNIMIQDIYSGNGADVYFPGTVALLQAVDGDYGVMVEDISDIYDMQPLNLDGTEEQGQTIKEKVQWIDHVINDDIAYNGKYYTIPWTVQGAGMAVNMNVLGDEYGYTMDQIPVTTKELFDISDNMMENIMLGAAPYTFSLKSNGYCSGTENNWFIQYEGQESYDEYNGFINTDGSWRDCIVKGCDGSNCNGHAYDVFKKEGLIEMLAASYELFDPARQTNGVASQDFKAAQAQFCAGKSAFYFVSGWMLNEQVGMYAEEMKNIHFVRIPVISALGPKLDLCGKGHVEKAAECFEDCAECEALLSTIIRGFDAHKSAQEVSSITGVSVEKVERVFEARAYVKDGSGTPAVINAKISEGKKEIVKLLLRMLASDEGAALMAKHTNTVNPFNPTCLTGTEYDWLDEITEIFGDDRTIFYDAGSKEYRAKMGVVNLCPLYGNTVSYTLFTHEVSIFDDKNDYAKVSDRSVYRTAAYKAIYGDDKDDKYGLGIYGHAKYCLQEEFWKIPE